MTHFIDDFITINQNRLWLLPFLDIHQTFAKEMPKSSLYEWLNDYFNKNNIPLKNHQNHPLSFTHQNDLVHGTAYEAHIGKYHQIPTRDNLHDWFGACVWSAFPKTKSLLNAKHLIHINDNDSHNKRNRVRDAITVFDENGAVLVVSDDDIGNTISSSLKNFDWQTCLVKNRVHWSDYQNDNHKKAKLFLFGHALLEQLINPYKSLCSHTVIINVPTTFFNQNLTNQLLYLDDYLYFYLNTFLDNDVTPKQFNPLPILGVPHFWDNANHEFYNDPFVFRNGRKK